MKPHHRVAVKTYLSLLGLMVLGPSVFYSTDFSPSWGYLAAIAAASVFSFSRIRAVFAARKEVVAEGLLATANVNTYSFFATLLAAYLIAMPVGKFLTFTLGSSTNPVGTPIDTSRGSPRLFCSSTTLVELENGDSFWTCGATRPDMAPSARIHLVKSPFGYYATLQGVPMGD